MADEATSLASCEPIRIGDDHAEDDPQWDPDENPVIGDDTSGLVPQEPTGVVDHHTDDAPRRATRDDARKESNGHLRTASIRPCLFHTEEISGVLIAESACADAGLLLYTHSADRGRERISLPTALPLPSGLTLQFEPPTFPSLDGTPRWSPAGRQAFLDGRTPDPAVLFERVRRAFVDHIVFAGGSQSEGDVATLALWTALTYCYPAWSAVPYLAIGGHLGSGKTRVLEILRCLAFNPMMSASATPAIVYRTLNDSGGTLLLDESETLGARNAGATELNRILNAGYKAGGNVHRLGNIGGRQCPVSFDVFSPKAIAGISPLSSTLESRCIRLTMSRASETSPEARRIINGSDAEWAELRDDLYSFGLHRGPELAVMARRTDLCGFGGRGYELWQPLLVLAHVFEDAGIAGLVSKVEEFADLLRDSKENTGTPQPDELLLRQLAECVRANRQGKLTPKGLLEATTPADPDVFAGWTPKRVSSRLDPYGIRAVKTNGCRTYRDVTREDLRRIQELYGLDLDTPPTDPTDPSDPGMQKSPFLIDRTPRYAGARVLGRVTAARRPKEGFEMTQVFECQLNEGIKESKKFKEKGLAGYAVNVGLRCGHGCEYCSTGVMNRTRPWFQQESVKQQGITSFTRYIAVVDPGIANRVVEDAKRIGKRDTSKRGMIEVCTTTDAWSPEARKHGLGRRILEAILEQPGWTVRVLTKSAYVVDDFDVIKKHRTRVLVGISLTATPDKQHICSVIEPHASTILERMDAIRTAHKQGLRTYGMLCPLLPSIGNSPTQIEDMVKFVVSCGAEEIFVEPVNLRGPNLKNTQEALEAQGYKMEAAAVQEIRKTGNRSAYTRQLITDVQRVVRKHFDIGKLRVLLYPSNLTPHDKKAIQRDDKGIVWLGK